MDVRTVTASKVASGRTSRIVSEHRSIAAGPAVAWIVSMETGKSPRLKIALAIVFGIS